MMQRVEENGTVERIVRERQRLCGGLGKDSLGDCSSCGSQCLLIRIDANHLGPSVH